MFVREERTWRETAGDCNRTAESDRGRLAPDIVLDLGRASVRGGGGRREFSSTAQPSLYWTVPTFSFSLRTQIFYHFKPCQCMCEYACVCLHAFLCVYIWFVYACVHVLSG